jgi:choice-of-anchor C domain-containing protein
VLIAVLGSVAAVILAVGLFIIVRNSTKQPGGGPLAALGIMSRPVVGPELITNGSFEQGPPPWQNGRGFTTLPAGSTHIHGWTVTRGSIDYIDHHWRHADGERSIDLNGNEPGAIEQVIRTQPGKRYRVTFSMSGNNCLGSDGGIRTLTVRAAGDRGEFTFDTTGRTYEQMGWTTKTWEFTATAENTILEFASATDIPFACGPAIDRVSVREVGG